MGLGSLAHMEAVGGRAPLSPHIYQDCCQVDIRHFNQEYSLDKTVTAGELDMLRRAYGRAGRDFEAMVAQHQQELANSSLRFDGYRQNGELHATIHWEGRARDMSRLRLLDYLVDLLDVLGDAAWHEVVMSYEHLSIRSLLTQEGVFARLAEYEADAENKRTPLQHVLAVILLMNRTDRLPPDETRHFWLEARFWMHALHDLKKAYGSRSPLHTKLGRDLADTFFWYQNSFAKAAKEEIPYSDEMIETVTFLIEWHHLFMYLNSYLPEDFMTLYKQARPKDSQEMIGFMSTYSADKDEPLAFDFGLLQQELPQVWARLQEQPQLLHELYTFTQADTHEMASDSKPIFGPLNEMLYAWMCFELGIEPIAGKPSADK